MVNEEIRLRARPRSPRCAADFELALSSLADCGEGDVLVDVEWLSIDPYLFERAMGARVGAQVALGARMPGRGIGRVVSGALPAGTRVAGELGWQRRAVVPAASLVRVPDDDLRPTLHLGVLGVPGLTAWLALFDVASAAAGETVLITSAAGTVGSIAGQLARRAGMRVVGVTVGAAKCNAILAAGFDAAVDRHQSPLAAAIEQACAPGPGDRAGFDVLIDLAGGAVLTAALPSARERARLVLCGHVASYDGAPATLDADLVLYRRLAVHGFLVHDHAPRFAAARARLEQAVRAGALSVPETVHEGLASAPAALEALLCGVGIGKHLVRVA